MNQAAGFDILKAGDAVETCIDGSCLIHKEESQLGGQHLMTDGNNNIDFTQSFLAFAEQEGLIQKGEDLNDFPTLYNAAGREHEHHSLLQRMGFPSQPEPETGRYVPVVEGTAVGPFYQPANHTVVNEAGQNLGYSHTGDALTPPQLGDWDKGGVVEGGNSEEMSITKSFLGLSLIHI